MSDDHAANRIGEVWPLYRTNPDYMGAIVGLSENQRAKVDERIARLYGEDRVEQISDEIDRLVKVHNAHKTDDIRRREADLNGTRFTERDIVLITYGDLIVSKNQTPLQALSSFVEVFFKGLISTVHILPFYPYSSDRGFSVTDYREVDPKIGAWEDIANLKSSFNLMFDGVFNHVSSQSRWFQDFLDGVPSEQDAFIDFSRKSAIDEDHLALILRPRTSDLLTEFPTVNGPRFVWTTFSADQIDLNFKSPEVLLTVASILLYYVRMGADIIRLDAITYLWYEIGTSCAHLENTHEVVKLMRDILDAAAPNVALITETNVPHADNITYFGNGHDEAQMVYNFALPPLVLHSFQTERADILAEWASALEPPSEETAFFNFLDSHDGIGLMGARGALSEDQIGEMCDRVRELGGFVSMKNNGDGTESPYELNITWSSALCDPDDEDQTLYLRRFIASRAIALAVKGVPAIYLPSMFGAKNDTEAVGRDGSKRSINRATIHEEILFKTLGDPASPSSEIARRFIDLLEIRVEEPAFHPNALQHILRLDDRIFSVKRISVDGGSEVVCLVNVSGDCFAVPIPPQDIGTGFRYKDLISGRTYEREDQGFLTLEVDPYDVIWLKTDS